MSSPLQAPASNNNRALQYTKGNLLVVTNEKGYGLEIVGRVSYLRASKVKPELLSPPQYKHSP